MRTFELLWRGACSILLAPVILLFFFEEWWIGKTGDDMPSVVMALSILATSLLLFVYWFMLAYTVIFVTIPFRGS